MQHTYDTTFVPMDHRQNQAALFAEKNGLATAEDVRPEFHWYHTADGTESDAAGYISDSVAGQVLNPLVSNKYAFTAPQDRWDYADQLLEDSVWTPPASLCHTIGRPTALQASGR